MHGTKTYFLISSISIYDFIYVDTFSYASSFFNTNIHKTSVYKMSHYFPIFNLGVFFIYFRFFKLQSEGYIAPPGLQLPKKN